MSLIPYSKPATTYAQQMAKLKSRGMIIANEDLAKRWLKTVGYYRLSIYWLNFETSPAANQTRSKTFRPGTTFEQIVDLYKFDRELRLLVTEAIERTEIALRTSWTYHMSNAFGAHAYLDPSNFSFGLSYYQQMNRLSNDYRNSSEKSSKHYRETYHPPILPPIWIATELMTFGSLSIWLKNTESNSVKQKVANDLGLGNIKRCTGTIQALCFARNICAHHGRLWNRKFTKRFTNINAISTSLILDATRTNVVDNTSYNLLTFLAYLLKIQSPDTTFAQRAVSLIESYPSYIQNDMGIPRNWKSRPIWMAPTAPTPPPPPPAPTLIASP